MPSFIWEWKRYRLPCNHQPFLEKIARTHDTRYTECPQVTTKWQVFWKSLDLKLPLLHNGTRNSGIPEFHILAYWWSYVKPHVTYVERSKALVITITWLSLPQLPWGEWLGEYSRGGNVTTRRNHGGCRFSELSQWSHCTYTPLELTALLWDLKVRLAQTYVLQTSEFTTKLLTNLLWIPEVPGVNLPP
jgi:hypothetical protein